MSKRNTMNELFTTPKILFIIFIGFGICILATNMVRQLSWETTTGVVLEVKERIKNKNQFYPVVEFKTETGENVQVEIKQSSNRFFYRKGDNIPIIYPNKKFKKAKINSKGWTYGFPFLFIVLGLIGFLFPSSVWHKS